MRSTRPLFFLAALTALLTLPSRLPADEPEGSDEPEASTTGTATTEAAAPSADEAPAPKRVLRAQRDARPRAQTRNPDTGGGGGGGGGAFSRRPGGSDDDEGDGGQTSTPNPPLGKPVKDDKGCDMPPLHHINVHLMGGNGNRFKVDSTPIVCSTDAGTRHERYCQETMGDNNRRCCPVKPEGHPLRVACELILLGTDPTDGIAGPHWSYIGSDGGVERHPENPFLAFAYGKGIVRACSNVSKACGETSFQVPNYGKK